MCYVYFFVSSFFIIIVFCISEAQRVSLTFGILLIFMKKKTNKFEIC